MHTTILKIGDQAVSMLDLTVAAAILALILLLITVWLAWRAGRARRLDVGEAQKRAGELEFRLAEMTGQLKQLSEHSQMREGQMSQTLNERLDQMSQRVGQGLSQTSERTIKSLQNLNERLAVIDSAQANLTALSTEMVSLKDILSNKQARGAYGQARMEAIIRDGLHQSAFSFQATLSNNTRPDCVINLPDSPLKIVVDAKFPLEAFNAFKAAKTEIDLKQAGQRMRADIGKHVKDIATKYLIAGETHEPGVMFVPSESIYAELYENFEDVIQKAHRQRIIIASPNILMLLVQTMQAVFKDSKMREQAGLIQTEVVKLLDDVERLHTRVIDLQRHYGQAGQDIDKLLVSADKITKRGRKIEQLELQEDEPAPALDESEGKPRLVAGGKS